MTTVRRYPDGTLWMGYDNSRKRWGPVWIPVRLIGAAAATTAATWGLMQLALHLLG